MGRVSADAGPRGPSELTNNYDMVVIGAGAAGMTAALVGAICGLRVCLIEQSTQVGGTSAWAAGTLWIPGNCFMPDDEARADTQAARSYLNALVGANSPSEMRETFLGNGPAMLTYLQQHSGLRFKPCPRHADYHPETDGARSGGRPVEAELFDARQLGNSLDQLRAPIAEFMMFRGMMVSKADIDLLLQAGKRWAGTRHAVRLGARYLRDRITYSRGTRLAMGNGLCGSLFFECLKRDVTFALNTTVNSIEPISATSHRVQVSRGGASQPITATRGVVFAGGGFSGNSDARAAHLPKPTPQFTAAFKGADGSSQALALSLGAQLGATCEHNAWWFPSSVITHRDGSESIFPHIIMDRAKPGLIAVNKGGARFVNEGISYHQFARAQYVSGAIPCWLVCDAAFIRRYGLGAVRPGGWGLRRAVASGYVKTAATLASLAELIGVDATGLIDSAARMTRFAASGVDEDFGKGSDSLSRQNGDPTYPGPSPCLGPVAKAPFYAIAVSPADLGTSRGLLTDTHGRLLNAHGESMPGLYAGGNDMQSVMGGQYPAPGVTLGPGMTFAYLAARDCAAGLSDDRGSFDSQ